MTQTETANLNFLMYRHNGPRPFHPYIQSITVLCDNYMRQLYYNIPASDPLSDLLGIKEESATFASPDSHTDSITEILTKVGFCCQNLMIYDIYNYIQRTYQKYYKFHEHHCSSH